LTRAVGKAQPATGAEVESVASAFGPLFDASSIALVGASESSHFARVVIRNLEESGFGGTVSLVHPRHGSQFGRRCWRSLAEVPDPVDVAYVLTGQGALAPVLAECGAKGVAWAVVLASGYREAGSQGDDRQRELARLAQAHGVRLLGPNALGFLNVRTGLAAYGNPIAQPLVRGPVGLVSHSGGMAVQLHRYAVQRAVGMSRMASLGNSALTTSCDLIEYLVADDETRVIGCLLETLDSPERFGELALAALDAAKPLVVLKIGRSEASTRSVTAHIGALAGEDRVVDGFFRQVGVLRVSSIEQLVDTCGLLAARGWPTGGRTAVITMSGGASGIAADLASTTRVELPELSPATAQRLDEVLGGNAVAQNPLDITGFLSVKPDALASIAGVVAGDASLDAVVTVLEAPRELGPTAELRLGMARGVVESVTATGTYCVLASAVASELSDVGRSAVTEHGLHYANGLAASVTSLDRAIEYSAAQRRRETRRGDATPGAPARLTLPSLPQGSGVVLTEDEALTLVGAAGIRVPRRALVSSPDEAADVASAMGFPVVVKVQSADVPHKTEVGGVLLGIRRREDARAAYETVLANVTEVMPDARIDGVLVAEQFSAVAELLVGFVDDADFGPVVSLGTGGVLAEVLDEVAVRVAPLDELEAESMLAELRSDRLLHGFRGRAAGDVRALITAVVATGRLALALRGRVRELEVNPLLVLPEGAGVAAGDALAVLA
jgi:acyl-CoA synthetase (NDP forming)